MSLASELVEPSVPAEKGVAWFKRAVIYELHVRAFRDSDGNGIGDFPGLIEKLDYIRDLGVTAIWLLPFCPSPWRDDGYDIADYLGIHPQYGCMDDFRRFLDESKRRNLRVITELVINHTSSEHPWFQRARISPPGSAYRNYYVWSDTPDRYKGVRVIFKDFETSNWAWDPVAQAWYWHRFYSHQPDLNFDSPDVRRAVFETVDFWLGMGVDGLRLDAVPYLFEREGTTCENLPETHAFLRELRAWVDSRYTDRMLLAEANQWPEDAVAYFGSGDECHMAFHFPLMPRLFMATRMEDAFPISNIVAQTPPIPGNCQWATFLRNHDELTLEMVGEEERDYMYRTYARDPGMRLNIGIRRRLAPLLDNDRRRLELMNALLLSLPGTPVIYYGDEIGMGEDLSLGDRNGVRTPMQWTAGKNAGFSEAEAEDLYLPAVCQGWYNHAFVNVAAQETDSHSLLWWMRRALAVRRESQALTDGAIEFVRSSNRHVLAFLRRGPRETALVVANLSMRAQPVQLPLEEWAGFTPVEMFGRVSFPRIQQEVYPVSLAPYGFYWFLLREPPTGETSVVKVPSFSSVFDWANRADLAAMVLPGLARSGEKIWREATHLEIIDVIQPAERECLALAMTYFAGGEPLLSLIPLAITEAKSADPEQERLVLLETEAGETGLLHLARASGAIADFLLRAITGGTPIETRAGVIEGESVGLFAPGLIRDGICLLPGVDETEQRNISISLSDLFVLKLFRRLEPGPNPDISTVRYLFEDAGFSHVAPAAGVAHYHRNGEPPVTFAALHAWVGSRNNLWNVTLEELDLFLGRAAACREGASVCDEDLIRTFLSLAALLGKRTAAMHLALASAPPDNTEFAPELSDSFYLRGVSHTFISSAHRVFALLSERLAEFSPEMQKDAEQVLASSEALVGKIRRLQAIRSAGLRIRVHGDLHLGQVLYTGDDVIFIDFEGDSSRPLQERLLKQSALVDIAGMVHSLHYAAASAGLGRVPGAVVWRDHPAELREWTNGWRRSVVSAFLEEYRNTAGRHPFIPQEWPEFESMLSSYMAARAIYQLGYELEHRPDWAPVALRVVLDM